MDDGDDDEEKSGESASETKGIPHGMPKNFLDCLPSDFDDADDDILKRHDMTTELRDRRTKLLAIKEDITTSSWEAKMMMDKRQNSHWKFSS